mgnify:FL=1|tara:strand:- start:355 stop:474 length:120 start_codon:yes stop_codon:yes gene_type:complete
MGIVLGVIFCAVGIGIIIGMLLESIEVYYNAKERMSDEN